MRTLAEHMAKLPNLPEVLRARHPLASVEDSDYESNGDGSVKLVDVVVDCRMVVWCQMRAGSTWICCA